MFSCSTGSAALILAALTALAGMLPPLANAQAQHHPEWQETNNFPTYQTGSNFEQAIAYDDGTGPALYAIRGATYPAPASTIVWDHQVLKWNGAKWSLPGGKAIFARSGYTNLAVLNDGTGPALYTTASFTPVPPGVYGTTSVLKYTSVGWTAIAPDPTIHNGDAILRFYDDGTGMALYAAVGPSIKRWDGAAWTELAITPPPGTTNFKVNSISDFTAFDDGTGTKLFVCGQFKWNQPCSAITSSNTSGFGFWDGTSWTLLQNTPSCLDPGGSWHYPRNFAVFDDGSGQGSQLYMSGVHVTSVTNQARGGTITTTMWSLSKWNGTQVVPAGKSITQTVPWVVNPVYDHHLYSDYITVYYPSSGMAPVLVVIGYDLDITPALQSLGYKLAFFNGSAWTYPEQFISGGNFLAPTTLVPVGATLYCHASHYPTEGGISSEFGTMSWTPAAGWSSFQVSLDAGITALYSTMGNSGTPALYVGGEFETLGYAKASRVAKRISSGFQPMGDGFSAKVTCFAEFDAGNGKELYAGGYFEKSGTLTVNGIARWDGTNWQPVGTGLLNPLGGSWGVVDAMAVYDDGTGPALFVGGTFTTAGGVPAAHLAKWDGTQWSATNYDPCGFGTPEFFPVSSLRIFNDGTGPALFVGHSYGVEKRLGQTWTADIGGLSCIGRVDALTVHDDGTGPALYVAGEFLGFAGMNFASCVRWDGQMWVDISPNWAGSGVFVVNTFAEFDEGVGAGPELFAAGTFQLTSGLGQPRQQIAKWSGTAWTTLSGAPVNGIGRTALAVHDDGLGTGSALWVGSSCLYPETMELYLGKWGHSGACGSTLTYGVSCAGSGGVAPQLQATGCPTSGGSVTLRVDGAKSGSIAIVFVGLNQASIPAGGECVLNAFPILTSLGPLPLFGVGLGTGYVQLTSTLPAGTPSTTIFLTAACSDSGAPLGYTLTNGVRFSVLN